VLQLGGGGHGAAVGDTPAHGVEVKHLTGNHTNTFAHEQAAHGGDGRVRTLCTALVVAQGRRGRARAGGAETVRAQQLWLRHRRSRRRSCRSMHILLLLEDSASL